MLCTSLADVTSVECTAGDRQAVSKPVQAVDASIPNFEGSKAELQCLHPLPNSYVHQTCCGLNTVHVSHVFFVPQASDVVTVSPVVVTASPIAGSSST